MELRGIIAHNYCRAASYELDELMLAELDRFVGCIAGRLHPCAPWPPGRRKAGVED